MTTDERTGGGAPIDPADAPAAGPICPCGKPATIRRLLYKGVEYAITDPCEACIAANRQRLDLLSVDNPSPAELMRRLLEPKS